MNQEPLNLEQYRCRKCGRLFCIKAGERHPLDVDFGCPYGCDDNGERIWGTGIEAVAAGPDVMAGIKDHRIVIELCEGDFESSMSGHTWQKRACSMATLTGTSSTSAHEMQCRVMKMNEDIKETIRFVLADDNEGMRAAIEPDSDLDPVNKQMNRELIQKHEQILAKLDRDEALSQDDLVLIRDANEIHVNDSLDLGEHHRQALALEEWLAHMMEIDRQTAMRILKQWLHRDSHTPARGPPGSVRAGGGSNARCCGKACL
jgi:hypothetical protein